VSAVRGAWCSIAPGFGRLLVKWGTGDTTTFDALRAQFRAQFPMARWAATEGSWSVPLSEQRALARWVAAHFDAETVNWPGPRPTSPAMSGLAAQYARLHLLPSAPPELVEASRRVLARRHHPDVAGGDPAHMVAVNSAADAILAAVGRK
jgi:hypothetical protein